MTPELTPIVALVHRPVDDQPHPSHLVYRLFDLLGGIETIVQPGMSVFIKPDLRCGSCEEARSHVGLVAALARTLMDRGAYVIVADSPFLDGTLVRQQYHRLGLADAAERVGFCLIDLEAAGTEPVALETRVFYVAKAAAEADLIVNVPRLRPHLEFGLTGAIENIVGVLPGFQKVALLPGGGTRTARIAALVDLYAAVAPGLTIIDGLETLSPLDTLIDQESVMPFVAASRDGIALDAIVAERANLAPEMQQAIRLAADAGLGIGWPEGVRLVGESWKNLDLARVASENKASGAVPDLVAGLIGPFVWSRPVLNREVCDSCGVCVKNCPTKALRALDEISQPTLEPQLCIGCHRCSATCPQRAMEPRQSRLAARLAESRRRNCDF